jgi:hypothetical protein
VRVRDYAYEALAEVTACDQEVARGQLNAALRDIRAQEPALASIEDSYLLSAEIYDRGKMYRAMFPDIALTPNALAKHWKRVKEDAPKKRGSNLHAGRDSSLPPSRREQNLNAARQAMKELWG